MSRPLAIAALVCAIVTRVHAGPAEDLDAARAAERAGDYPRAVQLLERVADATADPLTRKRARADIARLSALTTPVASEHARLAERIRQGGDPRDALRALGALVREHPTYSGAVDAMLVIAQGWEREGDMSAALDWLREAARPGGVRARAELARALVRDGRADEAEQVIAGIDDVLLAASLRAQIEKAEQRTWVRRGVAGVLALLMALGLIALRRVGWRRLRRVPIEVLYYAPIAGLLAVVAQTGNPLVARAVQWIALGGLVVGWGCGTLLEGQRRIAYVLGAVLAMVCLGYLVLDHEHLIDLLLETWRSGPAMR